MWGWLQRLLAKREPPAIRPSLQRDPPRLRVINGGLSTGSAWEQLLALTGQETPAFEALTPLQLEREEALAERVLGHFRKNQPAPSALPAISLQVLNMVAEPDLSLSQLTRVVAQDPAFSAAILKVANSVSYEGVQEIQTLREAVARLGLTEVGRVAGVVSARSLFQPQVRSEFSTFGNRWSDLFAEAVAGARGAAWLAMKVPHARTDQVFLAGILHDVGRSVALRSVAALHLAEHCFEVEGSEVDRVIERVHVEIGGEVHASWNLPRFSTLVSMRHHDLGLPADAEYAGVHCVRLASTLLQTLREPWRVPQSKLEIDESARALQLDGYGLRSLDTQLRTELQGVIASSIAAPRRRAGSNF